jgi:hypothetical protein
VAVPNVTIEGRVWGEWEYEALQAALGLPMRADAVGRAASLWHWCLSEETDIAPVKVVDGKLGKGGAAALVDCGLGEVVDGGIRVRGAAARVSEWQERQEGWSNGGTKAAANAKKVGRTRGRFRKEADKPTSSPPADDQLVPAAVQQATSPHQPSSSVSSSPSPPEEKLSPANDIDWRAGGNPARRRLAEDGRQRLNELRRQIAADFKIAGVLDLAAFATDELLFRLAEVGSEEAARLALSHALACLEAEARASRSVQYLTGAAFSPNSWRRLLGMTPSDAARSKAGAGGQGWRPRVVQGEVPRKIPRLR